MTGFGSTGDPSSFGTHVFLRSPSGRIVIVGRYQAQGVDGRTSGIAMAALTSSGTLDPNFGSGGKVLIWSSFQFTGLSDAAMNSDGSILLFSQFLTLPTGANRCILVRYTADGTPDPTFNPDLVIGQGQLLPVKIRVAPSGKIYVLLRRSTTNVYELVRLNADGSRDTSFAPDGVRTINLNRVPGASISGIHELHGAKILITGDFDDANFQSSLFAARLNPDGNFDRTFGLLGIVKIADPGGGFSITRSVIQPDGKILLGGTFVFLGSYALLVRLTPRGRLDTGFGTGGISMTALRNLNIIQDIALAPDGKIAVTGTCGDKAVPSNQRLFVAMFSAAGIRESAMQTGFITGRDAGGYGVDIQPDGKIVAAGFTLNPTGNFTQFAAARFNP